MSGHNRKRRKKSANRARRRAKRDGTRPVTPDEVFESPLLRMSRFGDKILFQGMLNEESHAQYRARLEANRPDLKRTIDTTIAEISKIFALGDALDLLTPIIISRGIVSVDPSDGPEAKSEEQLVADIDYLLSIALAIAPHPTPRPASPEQIQSLIELVTQLRHALVWYWSSEPTGEYGDNAQAIRFHTLLESAFVRGEVYWAIERELLLDLFSRHRAFLDLKYGFSVEDILDLLERSERNITSRLTEGIKKFAGTYERFLENIGPVNANEPLQSEADGDFLRTLESTTFSQDELAFLEILFTGVGGKSLFEVIPTSAKDLAILTKLSATFGSNREFLASPEFSGWPTNQSIVHTRPFIVSGDSYYLPNIAHAYRCLRRTVESLIEEKDLSYFQTKYVSSRHDFLVDRVKRAFSECFGDKHVWTNLFYPIPGTNDTAELDLLVVYGDSVLLVEMKAGAMSPSSRRGGVQRIRRDIGKLVKNAQDQCTRATRYLDGANEVVFQCASGFEVRVRKQDIRHRFLINITLEQLSFVPMTNERLSICDLDTRTECMWSISLADFLAVHEVLDNPGVFLHFLKQRLQLYSLEYFEADDELDLLMLYIEKGLLWQGMEGRGGLKILSHTPALDKYYTCKAEGIPCEKPKLNLPPAVEVLLNRICAWPNGPHVTVAMSLLAGDNKTRRKLGASIVEIESRCARDRGLHTATVNFKDNRSCNFLICSIRPIDEVRIQEYAMKVKQKHKVNEVHICAWMLPLSESVVRCLVL